MQKILISACLLGEKVRYDEKNLKVENTTLQQWIQQDRVISFCPEVAGGLAVPRTAAEISGGDGHDVVSGTAQVIDKSGHDVTTHFLTGARLALDLCRKHKIKIALLARHSPSCGDQRIYNGHFNRTLINGVGVTAALLKQNGIKVFNQTTIEEARLYLETI